MNLRANAHDSVFDPVLDDAAPDSFVVLQIARERFALPANIIAELAPPVRLHAFPHTSPLLTGVIVRRGRIVPVFDAGRALSGKSSLGHRFYLIARHQIGNFAEMAAIPVDGECELVSSTSGPPAEGHSSYVTAQITAARKSVGVLDLHEFVRFHTEAAREAAAAERVV